MYVCLCHGVTDRAIREAAECGARDLADLTAMTGCAGSCGCCAEVATATLQDARQIVTLPLMAA